MNASACRSRSPIRREGFRLQELPYGIVLFCWGAAFFLGGGGPRCGRDRTGEDLIRETRGRDIFSFLCPCLSLSLFPCSSLLFGAERSAELFLLGVVHLDMHKTIRCHPYDLHGTICLCLYLSVCLLLSLPCAVMPVGVC